jgi:CRP-like cAMP-binding protein
MLDNLINRLSQDKTNWGKFHNLFQEREIAPKTTLLNEGEVSQNLYFIRKGCLRLWFNNDGKDITFQFFFENQAVSSIESFLEKQPSLFSLESIEPSKVVVLGRDDFDTLFNYYPDLKDGFQEIILKRLGNYANLFLSRIKDNPQKRYEELLKNNPKIIQRIPQHYIASYLGITPISLSRIRNKR